MTPTPQEPAPTPSEIEAKHTKARGRNVTTHYKSAFLELSAVFKSVLGRLKTSEQELDGALKDSKRLEWLFDPDNELARILKETDGDSILDRSEIDSLKTIWDEADCPHDELDHGICMACGEDLDCNSDHYGKKALRDSERDLSLITAELAEARKANYALEEARNSLRSEARELTERITEVIGRRDEWRNRFESTEVELSLMTARAEKAERERDAVKLSLERAISVLSLKCDLGIESTKKQRPASWLPEDYFRSIAGDLACLKKDIRETSQRDSSAELPSGAVVHVTPDASLECLEALNQMTKVAKKAVKEGKL